MEKSYLLPIHDPISNNVPVKCDAIDVIRKPCNYLKLIGINLLAFGLELCASAGFTYVPPIFLKNGFSDKSLTVILGIGPFISLILVPIIGRWSDQCQSRFGRRRPFMLVLGMIMIFSLLIIPFSHEISAFCGFLNPSFGLATGVILLDFSTQTLMNPCKALIPDIFDSLEEQNSGFTMYSCMLSLGGCFGYFITSFNWSSTVIGDYFGGQEKAVFSVLAILLLLLLVINLNVANEKPLENKLSLYHADVDFDKNFSDVKCHEDSEYIKDDKVNEDMFTSKIPKGMNGLKSHTGSNSHKIENHICSRFVHFLKPKSSFQILRLEVKHIMHSWILQSKVMFKSSFKEYFSMPPVLFRLFIACLFGWMGLMCHDMYYTDFVGQVIYRGKPQAEKESSAVILYDEGVRMGSWGLLLHCLFAAVYAAVLQDKLIRRYGQCRVYLFGMSCFTLSLLGTAISNSVFFVNIYSAASGLGLAAITTVPYTLVAEYYSKKEVYYNSTKHRGVGEDMAIIDSTLFLSQLIPAFFLGYIVEYTKTSAAYMIVAATCGAIACYVSCFVTFTS